MREPLIKSAFSSMKGRGFKKFLLLAILCISVLGFFYQYQAPTCYSRPPAITEYIGPERFVIDSEDGNNHKFVYNRNTPLIFIGGMPRSGTTLLRVLLDAHPEIRCGEETRVVPRVLGYRTQWVKAPFESRRLQEAGITNDVLDSAIAAFILEIIAKHGPPSPRLCNKDPFTLRSGVYLRQLFPNSKFIFMIRDGRAVVHSIISRKVTISGFDLKDFRQCMKKWNAAVTAMNFQCQELGPSSCLPVHYEQLVLRPKFWIEKILEFLEVPWNDSVLHHDQFVNKPGGITLSKLEKSTDQVIKPINLEALSKWVGQIPQDVVKDMAEIAPMLQVLGYDPNANPPDYGKPDSFVVENMEQLNKNRVEWQQKEEEVLKTRDSIRKSLLKEREAAKANQAGGNSINNRAASEDANNDLPANNAANSEPEES